MDAGIDLHTLIGFVNLEVSNGLRVESLFRYYGMTQDPTHVQHNYIKYTKPIGKYVT